MTSSGQSEHRLLLRRRGAALNSAIFEAVLAEIAESGCAALTTDRVVVERERVVLQMNLFVGYPPSGRRQWITPPW